MPVVSMQLVRTLTHHTIGKYKQTALTMPLLRHFVVHHCNLQFHIPLLRMHICMQLGRNPVSRASPYTSISISSGLRTAGSSASMEHVHTCNLQIQTELALSLYPRLPRSLSLYAQHSRFSSNAHRIDGKTEEEEEGKC